MDLAELRISEAIDAMLADGVEPIEVGLATVLTGLDYLADNACCDACLSNALAQVAARLRQMQRAQAAQVLH